MVPLDKSPGEENFSQISITGVITMTARESKNELAKMAKEGAFKRLLLAQGLKSVSSSNQKTVASYEGLVKTPVNIVGTEDFEKGVFHYKALIVFYSLPFPGQGTPLNPKDWIKEKLDDFFQFF